MSLNYLVPLVKCVLSWKINLAFFEKTTNCLPMFICRYIFSQQRFCDTTQYICCFDAFIENTCLQTWRCQTFKNQVLKIVYCHMMCIGETIYTWMTRTNTVLYYFWNLINVTFHLDLRHFERQVARIHSFWRYILSRQEIKE